MCKFSSPPPPPRRAAAVLVVAFIPMTFSLQCIMTFPFYGMVTEIAEITEMRATHESLLHIVDGRSIAIT